MPTRPLRVVYPMRFAKAPLRGLKPLVLVEETVDFEVREVGPIPLAAKTSIHHADFEWREFEGRHWASVFLPAASNSAVMEPVSLERRLELAVSESPVGYSLARQGSYPRAEVLSRGVTVLEDGRDERLAEIRSKVSDILVIDGVAHIACSLPEWRVGFLRAAAMSCHKTMLHTPLSHYAEGACGRFPLDRLEEALAFSKALWESFEGHKSRTNSPVEHDDAELEFHVAGSFPPPAETMLDVWSEVYSVLSQVEIMKAGTLLVRLLGRGLEAAESLRERPDDVAILGQLEEVVSTIADREDGFLLGTRHEAIKDMLVAHRLYRRMTEGLDADDVAALSI